MKPNLGCTLKAKKINLFTNKKPICSSRKGRLEKGEKNSADHKREENHNKRKGGVHFRYVSKKLSTQF